MQVEKKHVACSTVIKEYAAAHDRQRFWLVQVEQCVIEFALAKLCVGQLGSCCSDSPVVKRLFGVRFVVESS